MKWLGILAIVGILLATQFINVCRTRRIPDETHTVFLLIKTCKTVGQAVVYGFE
jgi:hypothetical protein